MLPRGSGLWLCFDHCVFSVAFKRILTRRSAVCQPPVNFSTTFARFAEANSPPNEPANPDNKISGAETGIDIERIFMRNDVQTLLKRTTTADANVIYARPRRRMLGRYPTNMEESKIKAMTDEELQKLAEKHAQKMQERLQIPPIMQERKPCEQLIVKDKLLASYDDHKHVFVDITYGVNPRKRKMVVRETDGRLRTADWDERDRFLQIYVPLEGRSVDVPKLFDPDNLKAALQQLKYSMVLDRACLQLEPDSPEYIRICQQSYDSIDANAAYAELQSTRHNAGLLFYLALHKRIDRYLNWCLREQLLQAAIHIVRLYKLIHNGEQQTDKTEAADALDDIDSGIKAIENYLQNDSRADSADRENTIGILGRLTGNQVAQSEAAKSREQIN